MSSLYERTEKAVIAIINRSKNPIDAGTEWEMEISNPTTVYGKSGLWHRVEFISNREKHHTTINILDVEAELNK